MPVGFSGGRLLGVSSLPSNLRKEPTLKRLRAKLTYANVISTLCLFLLLGGGAAFAATQMLPKNSVGPKQLKKGAVTPAKLSSGAKDAIAGPRGLSGPQGPQGVPGATGATGAPGQNLTAETPLQSGKTETGIFSAAGSGSPGFLVGTAVFIQPLSARLDESHVVTLAATEASAPHCPGVGHADPGYFCVYAHEQSNLTVDGKPEDPADGLGGANKDGAQFYFTISGAGASYVYGTWAVTAP